MTPPRASKKIGLEQLLNDALANRVEGQVVEFKTGRGSNLPEGLWRTITAFGNSEEGGVIYFGVEEVAGQPKVCGCSDPVRIQNLIPTYFLNCILNHSQPEVHQIDYEGHAVVALWIKPTPVENRPCCFHKNNFPQGACMRVGNATRELNHEEVQEMMRSSKPFKYDRTPVEGTLFQDLSLPKIDNYLTDSSQKAKREDVRLGMTEQVLVNAGVLVDSDGVKRPTIAGFLIFAAGNPMLRDEFQRLMVRCVSYRGKTAAAPIVDQTDISGTLDMQIEGAYGFLLKNINFEVALAGTKRVETFEYPTEALREAVANAVVHRDYRLTGTYTQVAVFSDRVEIVNPGGLAPGVTIRNLKNVQCSRNETIARVLRDMKYLEEFGRGIDLIYATMEGKGLPEPLFKNVANAFKITLLGPEYHSLNQRQMKILVDLGERNSPITSIEHANLHNVTRSTASADLAALVECGLIKKIGSGPKTSFDLAI